MTVANMAQEATGQEGVMEDDEYWKAILEDRSRTATPVGPPTKRSKAGWETESQDAWLVTDDQFWLDQQLIDEFGLGEIDHSSSSSGTMSAGNETTPFYDTADFESFSDSHTTSNSQALLTKRPNMRTGCVACLVNSVACDPRNSGCKLAMSDDWNLNDNPSEYGEDASKYSSTQSAMSLNVFRPDMKWRHNWRERHSFNFFVNFSAPQMAGFFDSVFWQRMVIQTSFHEPAILHAITAIGALHEAILQRAFADEKRKTQAMEFALEQCNKAITCLTGVNAKRKFDARRGNGPPNTRLALTTCVLFTCFEAMQGRCDSAVNHALQGRRLLQATSRPDVTEMTLSEQDDLEQMRPLVERLEVQATALLDKGKRPEIDSSDQSPPLPPVEVIHSLAHGHNTLHIALNSIMRFMQGFHPTAPADHIAVTMAEKYVRYAPWFHRWETAFTTFLAGERKSMSNMDLKRAMVLKANHLVGTMLASIDQSAGPSAYDVYEAEFKAIVDLSREVLATFSCPPLPALSGGSTKAPYLSFSLWVTDPLWMAISRCRNPSIRQAAFTLLSQNPRQEGIWHAGPHISSGRYMRRVEANTSLLKETVRSSRNPDEVQANHSDPVNSNNNDTNEQSRVNHSHTSSNEAMRKARPMANTRVRGEWVDLRAHVQQWTTEGEGHDLPPSTPLR